MGRISYTSWGDIANHIGYAEPLDKKHPGKYNKSALSALIRAGIASECLTEDADSDVFRNQYGNVFAVRHEKTSGERCAYVELNYYIRTKDGFFKQDNERSAYNLISERNFISMVVSYDLDSCRSEDYIIICEQGDL